MGASTGVALLAAAVITTASARPQPEPEEEDGNFMQATVNVQ